MSAPLGAATYEWTCWRCGFTFRNLTHYGLGASQASHKTWCWTKDNRS